MKLRPRTFRSHWELHAWLGVVASLLCFVVFFFGLFALFFEDLLVWQEPELSTRWPAASSDAEREPRHDFDRALAAVRDEADVPRGSSIGLWRPETTRWIAAFLKDPASGEERRLWVHPYTGRTVDERSRLAEELYVMHFFFRLPGGLELAGFVAVALLVLTAGGLLIHLKDLRRQAWRFRPGVRLRFSASDAHKTLGVFGAPLVTVLAWSGAVICLGGLIGQGLAHTNFDGSMPRVRELAGETVPSRKPAQRDARLLAPSQLVARARAVYGSNAPADYLQIRMAGDVHAWARVDLHGEAFEPRRSVKLDAVDGRVLADRGTYATPSRVFEETMWDLHFAQYGGLLLKWLYTLLALAGCAVVITGNLVWLERRDPRRESVGNRVLERLTVGVSAGAVLAAGAYFVANRVLPWELAERAEWEWRIFLGVWAFAVCVAQLRPLPVRSLGSAYAGLAALALGGVAAARAFDLKTRVFAADTPEMDAVCVVGALLVALASACAAMAWKWRSPAPGNARAPTPQGPRVRRPTAALHQLFKVR